MLAMEARVLVKLNGEEEALYEVVGVIYSTKIQNISRQRNPAFEVRTQAKIFYTHRPWRHSVVCNTSQATMQKLMIEA